jgi:hypothetical protein
MLKVLLTVGDMDWLTPGVLTAAFFSLTAALELAKAVVEKRNPPNPPQGRPGDSQSGTG